MSDRELNGRRRVPRVGLLGALAFASALTVFASWLFLLPASAPRPLSAPEVRPELLDKPHRHQAAPPANSRH